MHTIQFVLMATSRQPRRRGSRAPCSLAARLASAGPGSHLILPCTLAHPLIFLGIVFLQPRRRGSRAPCSPATRRASTLRRALQLSCPARPQRPPRPPTVGLTAESAGPVPSAAGAACLWPCCDPSKPIPVRRFLPRRTAPLHAHGEVQSVLTTALTGGTCSTIQFLTTVRKSGMSGQPAEAVGFIVSAAAVVEAGDLATAGAAGRAPQRAARHRRAAAVAAHSRQRPGPRRRRRHPRLRHETAQLRRL